DPRTLVRVLRFIVGIVAVALGAVLILARRFEFGIPLVAAGLSAIFLGRVGPLDLTGPAKSTSEVRSTFLDMTLDRASGAMSGRVNGGTFEGRRLDDLPEADLRVLYREVSIDPES